MSAGTTTRKAARRTTKVAKPKPVAEEIEDLEEDAPEEVVEETPKKRTRKATKRKPEPEPVDEDEDDSDDDDEDDEPEVKPAKGKKAVPAKKAPPKREEPKYGTKWLAETVSEKLGREIKSYDLRAILRKLARAGKISRTIGETRDRYEFAGAKDPVVKMVVDLIKSGAVDKEKREKLAGLKSKASAKKTKKAAAEEEEFEDEDVEDLEDDDEDDE